MGLRKLLQSLTHTLPTVAKKTAPEVLEEADEFLPAIRKTTIPTEVGAEVLGKGTSRGVSTIDDIIDAELIPKKVSTIDAVKQFAKENPKKIIGGLTLAELARQMSGGGDGDITIPMAPQAKENSPGENKQVEAKIAQDVKKSSKGDSPSVSPTPVEKTEAESPTDERDLYADTLASAQTADSDTQFLNTLLRAANQAGSAIAGTKADYSGVEALEKGAGRNVANFKEQMTTKDSAQKLKKAKDELGDDDKMRDPNSEVSKLTSEIAAKAGLIKPGTSMSAMALKNSGVNLGVLLSTIEAGKARKEAMQMQREEKREKTEESNRLKVQSSVDKQTSQLLKSKDYEAYNAAKDAEFALGGALDSKDDKIKGGAAFMQYAKIAQGDNSVVRDGDMAQLAGRYNYTSVGDMFDKLKAQARGGNFGESELAQMREVAKLTQGIKGRRVQQLLTPIMKRADAAGLNLEETLDPRMVDEFQGIDAAPVEKTKTATPMKLQSPKTPGSIITTRSGKTYKVNAEGKTATEQ